MIKLRGAWCNPCCLVQSVFISKVFSILLFFIRLPICRYCQLDTVRDPQLSSQDSYHNSHWLHPSYFSCQSPSWFLGQMSIRYLRICNCWTMDGSDSKSRWSLVSSMRTGEKQMARLWGFILFLDDWEVTAPRWSRRWTRQFWNWRVHIKTWRNGKEIN